MPMFTLAISCLTTSSLPWFVDLTFQFPIQYCSYSIGLYFYHQTHPHVDMVSTCGCYFCFGSASSFLLELFLCSFPVAFWAPIDLGSSSFSVISFCLFLPLFWFSRQDCWSGLPIPSPVDHVLSELSTMTRRSWVALHGLAHSSIELDKAMIHVTSLVSFLWLWFLFLSAL